MTAVIMAGGKGTRLSGVIADMPKPMALICGKPVLEHQLMSLKLSGIKDIILVVGYLKETIIDYFGDGACLGVNISYIEEAEPLGTGGALYLLKNRLVDAFLFIFGDLMLDIDWNKMIVFHQFKHSSVTLFVHPNSHPYDSDLVLSDNKGRVTGWDSKHNSPRNYYYRNIVNAGIYVLSPKVFEYCGEYGVKDLEKDFILKLLMTDQPVYAYFSTEYVKDIGTPNRYSAVTDDFSTGVIPSKNLSKKQKCIFIDRDGTINRLNGNISSPNSFELYPRTADAIKAINASGYLCIVITNQPVVARGECSVEMLNGIHNKMETLLGSLGAYLDGIYYCPHHPDSGFKGEIPELKIKCSCRKPATGMLEQAAADFNIDMKQSWFVGDTTRDVQVGKNADIKTVLVLTGEGGRDGRYPVASDYTCSDLYEAVHLILNFKHQIL